MARSSARIRRIRRYREQLIAEVGALSISETALALRKGREHVRQLLDSGVLPYIKEGKRRRIRVIDLERYLASTVRSGLPEPDIRMRHKHRRPAPISHLKLSSDPDIAALFE